MPYIPKFEREKFNNINELEITSPGELNYCITKLILNYLNKSEKRYKDYNEVIGVLACAQAELYRKHVAIYENEALDKNGDV